MAAAVVCESSVTAYRFTIRKIPKGFIQVGSIMILFFMFDSELPLSVVFRLRFQCVVKHFIPLLRHVLCVRVLHNGSHSDGSET
jgi:hypothetical protein